MDNLTCLERCLVLKKAIIENIGIYGFIDGVLLSLPLETLEVVLVHVADYYNVQFSYENCD